jgi:hypothetical protein
MSRWIRIAIAATLAVSVAGFASACGAHPDLDDISEGQSFEMGELRYTVLYDRFLNPDQVEDADYVKGLPDPPAGQHYYGVFLIVKNEGGEDVTLPDRGDFHMEDAFHQEYEPLENEGNEFFFPFGSVLPKESEVPDPDSLAAQGPTQGSLLIFQVEQGITEEVPLHLKIHSADEEASIKLDV